MATSFPTNKPTVAEIAALAGSFRTKPIYLGTKVDYLFNQGAGSTFNDISGNSANLIGQGTDADDWTAEGVKFDGATEEAETLATTALSIPGNMSVEMWLNIRTFVVSQSLFEIAGGTGETESENIMFLVQSRGTSGNIGLNLFHEYGPGTNESVDALSLGLVQGTRYHLVLVRDTTAKTYSVYVDGVFVKSVSYVNNPTLTGVAGQFLNINGRVGMLVTTGDMHTTFHRFRVLNRALTAGEVSYLYTYPYEAFSTNTNPSTNFLRVDAGLDLSTWSAVEGASKGTNTVTFIQEASGTPGRVQFTFPVGRFSLETAHRFTGLVTASTLNYPHTDIKWFVKNERTGEVKWNTLTFDNHSDQGGQSEVGEAKPFNMVFYSTSALDQFTVGFENFANNQLGCTFTVSNLGVFIVV